MFLRGKEKGKNGLFRTDPRVSSKGKQGRPKGPSLELQGVVIRSLDLEGPKSFNALVRSTGRNRNAVLAAVKHLASINVVQRTKVGREIRHMTDSESTLRWFAYLLWKREPQFLSMWEKIGRTLRKHRKLAIVSKEVIELEHKYRVEISRFKLLNENAIDALRFAENAHLPGMKSTSGSMLGTFNVPRRADRLKDRAEQAKGEFLKDLNKSPGAQILLKLIQKILPDLGFELTEKAATLGQIKRINESMNETQKAWGGFLDQKEEVASLLYAVAFLRALMDKHGPGILLNLNPVFVRIFCLYHVELLMLTKRKRALFWYISNRDVDVP